MSTKPVVSSTRDEVRAVMTSAGRPAAMSAARIVKPAFEEKKP